MHEATWFETLQLAGVEPAASVDGESDNHFERGRRQVWLDTLYEISIEPSITGAWRHSFYIGKKRQG
ncbi:MAG: hypothetical protein M1281_12400 [Chloroflexi bacterium]|nr:hypothetical protein [Chloroflexota bacterium]